jgi:hypothetical protein
MLLVGLFVPPGGSTGFMSSGGPLPPKVGGGVKAGMVAADSVRAVEYVAAAVCACDSATW